MMTEMRNCFIERRRSFIFAANARGNSRTAARPGERLVTGPQELVHLLRESTVGGYSGDRTSLRLEVSGKGRVLKLPVQ